MERHLGRLTGALYYHSEKGTRGLQHHRYQRDPAVHMPPNTHTHTHIDTQPNPCKLGKSPQHTRAPTIRQDGLYGVIERYTDRKMDD